MPFSDMKNAQQMTGEQMGDSMNLMSNASVFDAFMDPSPDVFFLSARVGNGAWLTSRIFNRNLSPTQPYPKILLLPFNPNFGPHKVRRPRFLEQ